MKKTIEEIQDPQSVELLKALHILTRDGKINQDSRRKLKQVQHLYQFIEPLLLELETQNSALSLVDHGAGKSYLGFIIYDMFFKSRSQGHVYGVEVREDLILKSQDLQKKLNFTNMSFLHLNVADSKHSATLPSEINIVTALHACDTATDDAIDFALTKNAQFIVLIPCCQAEVASKLRENKNFLMKSPLSELFRHPIHTREFGSHLTNVLRCLKLEASGYQVTVTELTGLEHSMKNELIIAKKHTGGRARLSAERLHYLIEEFGLTDLKKRFSTETTTEKE